jgi:hypothetical protein
MTPSDELFQLIKSLTPGEKRYFKIHASRHVIGRSNNYEKLFDALDALPDDKDYDEAAFKKSLRGRSYGTHLSDEKSHLREILLRAMRLYHAERTPKGRLVEMIHEINFLYSKGFVRNCQQQIDKAMKLAADNELYTDMISLHDFLIRLYRENPSLAPYTVGEMEQQEKEVINQLMTVREAIYLRMKMTEIQTSAQWTTRGEEAKSYMQQAIAIVQASSNRMPVMASILLLSAQQQYLIHYHDYKQSLEVTETWMRDMEHRVCEIEALNDNYRLVLANYMMCAMHCGQMDLLPPAITKLKNCPAQSEKEQADSFRLSTQYELIYLMNSLDYASSASMLSEIEVGLKTYKRFMFIEQLVNFRFNISLLYFLKKKYSKCLDQIHDLYDLSGREQRYEYTTVLARTMEWMCQSSIGNHTILDTSLRSLKRLYADRNISNDFTDLMFSMYCAIIKEGNKLPAPAGTIKSQLASMKVPAEWEQLQAIVLSWI